MSSRPVQMADDCFRELTKFVQMLCADLIGNVPVDRLIAVNGDIPETNGFCETLRQSRVDDVKLAENCEVFGHGGGRNCVRISKKVIHGTRSLVGDPVDPMPKRFQFSFD